METYTFWVGEKSIRLVNGKPSGDPEIMARLKEKFPTITKYPSSPLVFVGLLYSAFWEIRDRIRSEPPIEPHY